jgi:hypothetical protein
MESLTPKPGIREQYRPQADMGRIEIPQRNIYLRGLRVWPHWCLYGKLDIVELAAQ